MIRVLDSAGSTLVEWGRQQQQQQLLLAFINHLCTCIGKAKQTSVSRHQPSVYMYWESQTDFC